MVITVLLLNQQISLGKAGNNMSLQNRTLVYGCGERFHVRCCGSTQTVPECRDHRSTCENLCRPPGLDDNQPL